MESQSIGVRDTIGHSVRTRSRPPARGRPHSSTRREQCPLSSLPPSSAASPPSRRPRSKYVFFVDRLVANGARTARRARHRRERERTRGNAHRSRGIVERSRSGRLDARANAREVIEGDDGCEGNATRGRSPREHAEARRGRARGRPRTGSGEDMLTRARGMEIF